MIECLKSRIRLDSVTERVAEVEYFSEAALVLVAFDDVLLYLERTDGYLFDILTYPVIVHRLDHCEELRV